MDRLDHETQFAALTVELSPGELFLSFRGTDNTLVGWKEDFNMSFVCPVPAQRLALDYVTKIAYRESDRLILGGHSKGGNLALYAACSLPEEQWAMIRRVFLLDGPGLSYIVDSHTDGVVLHETVLVPDEKGRRAGRYAHD